MTNSRHATRHACNLPAVLQHREMSCPCRVENLSASGALVRLKDSTREPLRRGDACLLSILRDPQAPLQVTVRVVHHGFTLVGLSFLEPERETTAAMGQLLELLATTSHHATFASLPLATGGGQPSVARDKERSTLLP